MSEQEKKSPSEHRAGFVSIVGRPNVGKSTLTNALVGQKGVLTVSATGRERCTRCMDCFHVCPEPQVLRSPVLNKESPPEITDRDCMTCGRCIDVCAEKVLIMTTRWSSGAKS